MDGKVVMLADSSTTHLLKHMPALAMASLQVPRLKLFVMEDGPDKKYCRTELILGDNTQPSSQMGPWFLFQVREEAREGGRG
jgi:hypothetical protein